MRQLFCLGREADFAHAGIQLFAFKKLEEKLESAGIQLSFHVFWSKKLDYKLEH